MKDYRQPLNLPKSIVMDKNMIGYAYQFGRAYNALKNPGFSKTTMFVGKHWMVKRIDFYYGLN